MVTALDYGHINDDHDDGHDTPLDQTSDLDKKSILVSSTPTAGMWIRAFNLDLDLFYIT